MNERIQRIKDHVRENKKLYLVAGGSALTTALLGTGVLIFAVNSNSEAQIAQEIRQIAWRPQNNQVVVSLTERSTPSKPVHLVGTNLYFDSLSDAARKTGHSLAKISRNVNGHIPDVGGDVFELLEPA
jgi:hypothetical protein